MDCEDCRHLTVVGLHDTGPRFVGRERREKEKNPEDYRNCSRTFTYMLFYCRRQRGKEGGRIRGERERWGERDRERAMQKGRERERMAGGGGGGETREMGKGERKVERIRLRVDISLVLSN